MSPDEELMVIFGALHIVALLLGGALFFMFLRSDTASTWQPPEEDDGGGGGNDRLPSTPKPKPTGGIPLPDAAQSGRRLRDHGRDGAPRRRQMRRPAHPPPPDRTPARRGQA